MLYRPLLISVIALGLTACFGESYENYSSGPYEEIPPRVEPSLPDVGEMPNGNLEESDTEATGWAGYANSGSATFELTTEQYLTGAQSYKISVNELGDAPSDIGGGPVGVPVIENYTYYFSAWVIGSAGATANFIAQSEQDPDVILGSQEIEVSGVWTRATFNFVAPAGVTSVQFPAQVSHADNGGAIFYIDYASLVGVEPPPTGIEKKPIPIEDDLAGWSADQAPTTLSYDADAGVVIEADWSADNQIAMYTFPEALDTTGLTFEYIIDVPQEYIDAQISVQPYIQQVGGSWAGDWSGAVDVADLVAGINLISYTPATNVLTDAGRIGMQVLGADRTADPASSISISEIYYEIGEEASSDLPLDAGWSLSAGGEPTYSEAGVSYSPTANDQNLMYSISGPENMEGATLKFTIIADQAYIDSGANLQPIAQQGFDPWTGEWNCWINNDQLSTDGAQHDCTLDEPGAPFNFTSGQSINVGLQAKGDAVAGTITITDVQIEYAGLPVTDGWRTSTGADPVYDEGVSYSPTAEGEQLLFDVTGPDNLEGAEFVFTIEASQEYIDSGANLQPIAQVKVGDWPGEWGCWINNSDLTTSGADHSCTLTTADFNLADETVMQIGVQTNGTPAGTIKITNVRIIYAD